MTLYITIKELGAFFKQKKEVFLWMIFCMICISFVMNYAFSYNRFTSNQSKRFFESRARYFMINCPDETDCGVIDEIKSELENNGFPKVKETYIFNNSRNESPIIGADYIGKNSDMFIIEEAWLETDDEILANANDYICVVSQSILDETDSMTVVGNNFEIDGEEFVIGGVAHGYFVENAMIPLDKFKEKYSSCREIDLFFSEELSETQIEEFYQIVQQHIEHGSIKRYQQPDDLVMPSYYSNMIQYVVVVLLSIVCLISMLEFWQDCNKTTYVIYWLNGATKSKLVLSSLLGIVILALGTYLIGLGLSSIANFIFPMLTSLELTDIVFGFLFYIICFIISGTVISIRKMNSVRISDIRRDV